MERHAITVGDCALSVLRGGPMVYLHGAKSGRPRTLLLLGIQREDDPGAIALVGTNLGGKKSPAWVFNLKAHPRVSCTWRGRTRACVAHEARDGEYEARWQAAVNTYPGFPVYKQRIAGTRPIPIMVPRSAAD